MIKNSIHVFSIPDIERSHRGMTYGDLLSIYHSQPNESFRAGINGQTAFYLKAYSYMLVLNGSAEMNIAQHSYNVSSGNLIVCTPLHLIKYVSTSRDFEFFVMSISTQMVDQLPLIDLRSRITSGLDTGRHPVSKLKPHEVGTILRAFNDLYTQTSRRDHIYWKELIENALCRFFLEYDSLKTNNMPPNENRSKRASSIFDQFIHLAQLHFVAHHDVSFYSDALNITPQYLTRITNQQASIKPSDFISELLYAEARNHLATSSATIQKIANDLGFSDQAAFCKFFRRRSGMSPKEFRMSYKL